jgi:hypothetical protein
MSERERLIDRMGDEDPGRLGLAHQLQELAAQAAAGHFVERRERLIVQQDRGLDGEGAGDGHTLAHAAGERVGKIVLVTAEAQAREPTRRDRKALLARDVVELQPIGDIVDRGAPGH